MSQSRRFRDSKRGRAGDDRRPDVQPAGICPHAAGPAGAHRFGRRPRPPTRRKTSATASSCGPTAEGFSDPNMQLGDTPAETAEIWRKLPPLYWLLEAQEKETAEVLAVADSPNRRDAEGRRLPVILQRRAGSGMVLFHATDETWRWRYRVGDVFFARYWVQSIRYLSRAKLLGPDQRARLTTNRKQYSRGEPVRVRLELFDPGISPLGGNGATVMLRRGDRAERPIQLTRNPAHSELFEGTIDAPAEGSYSVSLIDPKLPSDGAANGGAVGQLSSEGVRGRI